MKFLTEQEWEKLNKEYSSLTGKNKEKIEKKFLEIFQQIKNITYNTDHIGPDFFARAMTLFHYYTCFKKIRDLDAMEICYACKYMSYKIQFKYRPIREFQEEYSSYLKKQEPSKQNQTLDFMKYEIELYSLLGYDLDIETPYHFYHELLPSFYNKFPYMKDEEKMTPLKNVCYNIINDSYSKPLCIYFHPKIIALSCLIFALKFLKFDCDIKVLLEGENVKLVEDCMKNIYQIYAKYIEEGK